MNQLLSLLKEDQNNIDKYRSGQISLAELGELNSSVSKKFQEFVKNTGFPFKNESDEGVYRAAIALSLHSDIEFLKHAIEMLDDRGDEAADKKDKAYLVDKLRVLEGRPQLYGTQFSEFTGELLPVEDEINLNKRRVEAGLEELKKEGI